MTSPSPSTDVDLIIDLLAEPARQADVDRLAAALAGIDASEVEDYEIARAAQLAAPGWEALHRAVVALPSADLPSLLTLVPAMRPATD